MKNIYKIIVVILFITFTTCSDEDVYQRGYPKIVTISVKNINENGADFNAEVFNYENLDIQEYGFLWSESSGISLNVSEKKILSSQFTNGKFSTKVEAALKRNTEYFVRAYLKTDNYTVYGNQISFESKGSKSPKIRTIEPSSGVWGDTIQIKGTNFSYLANTNKVSFEGIKAEIIESNDSIVTCLVPPVENRKELSINLKLADNETNSPINFTILDPEITSLSSLTGTFRDEITVKGNNFGKKAIYNKFYFGNTLSQVQYIDKKTLKVIVPDNIASKLSVIKIISNSIESVFQNNFELLPPKITNINKLSVFTGDNVTIEGEYFHPIAEKNNITLSGASSEIISNSTSNLEAKIPVGPYSKRKIKAKIKILDMEFEYNTEIEIKNEWLLVSNDLPFNKSPYGPSNVVVANNKAYIIAFKKGLSFNDADYDKFFLWVFNEEDKTWQSEAIPITIGWINWSNLSTDSQNLYLYLPDQTNNFVEYNTTSKTWSAKSNFPGNKRSYITSFNINNSVYMGMGIDFEPYIPINYSDFYKYEASSDTWTRLNNTGLGSRTFSANFIINNTAYLLGGAFTTGHVDSYAYNQQNDTWTRKADLDVSFNRNTSFALNNKGYLVANGQVHIYDPNTNIWSAEYFLENNWREGNFSFSLNGKGYIGSGYVQNNNNFLMYEFKPN